MNDQDLINAAQAFRATNKILVNTEPSHIAAGQIRVLQHLQNFNLPSIYVLVLNVQYEKGAVRVAAIDPDVFYATPSDIVLEKHETKSSVELALIPTLSNWVEFTQLVEGDVRGEVDARVVDKIFASEELQSLITIEDLKHLGFRFGEIEIQPGDHAWLNRSLLVEAFHEFTVNLSSINDFSTEATTSWLYETYYSKINSYSSLFAHVPLEVLSGGEDSMNIDQARLIDMQIRGSLELQTA
jgi:hypothetical protein